MINPFATTGQHLQDLAILESELEIGLRRFWEAAAVTLNDSTIQLEPPSEKAPDRKSVV